MITAATPPRPLAFDTIVLGGGTAGVLDILDAFVMTWINGGSAQRVLHTIASGVLGRGAYQGGLPAAALGLGLHFVIAMSAATVYLFASRQLPALVRHPVACGLAFGVAVWAVMYGLVLPITFARPFTPAEWPQLANQIGIHAVGVGLPIALFANLSAKRRLSRESGTMRAA